MNNDPFISVVVPVYNEESGITAFYDRLTRVLSSLQFRHEIIFVLDPCTDSTERIILEMSGKDPSVKLIVTSRRFGQPACTLAGLAKCRGDVCVVIDADLQDPPELMPEMINKWKEGFKVVYAKRVSRKGETIIKRIISHIGYMLIEKISDIKIPRDTGDFRLLDRDVVDKLAAFKEHDAFLRGLVAYVGFRQTAVSYDRDERSSGSGKYNRFTGSLRIGLNGILNFSKAPLHLIMYLGLFLLFASFAALLFRGNISAAAVQLQAWMLVIALFLAGIQLVCLGILAQYFARVFDEIKGRPPVIIDRMSGFDENREPH